MLIIGQLIPALITLSGVIAIFLCFKSRTAEGLVLALVLSSLTIPAWTEAWSFPVQMGVVHIFALFGSMLMCGGLAARVMISLFAMAFIDCIQVLVLLPLPESETITNQALFWWRSAINVIYLYLCIITIQGCRNGVLTQGCIRVGKNGNFMARIKGGFHQH